MNYNVSVCSFAVADKILDRSHVMGEGFVLAHSSRAHSSPSQTKEVQLPELPLWWQEFGGTACYILLSQGS